MSDLIELANSSDRLLELGYAAGQGDGAFTGGRVFDRSIQTDGGLSLDLGWRFVARPLSR